MATYMIDYENVKTGGLNGISRLTAEDKVIIFYSENANRLTFDLHRRLMECPAQIEYREVLVGGHNALDFQLVTYLGYLIAKDPMGQYLIISYDRGFEYVVNFWRKDGLCIGLLPYLKDPSYALSKVVRGEIVRPEKEEESPEAKEAAEDAPESVAEEIPEEPAGEIPEEAEEGITVEFYEMTEAPAEEVTEAVAEVPAEEAAEAAPAEVTPAEAPAEEPAKPAKKSPAKKKQTAKKPKAVLAEAPKEEPKAEPKKDAPASKLPSEEELKTLLGDLVADDPEVRFVKGALEKYKTKLGLNNALVKNFGNQRAGEIYQKVKPFVSNNKK